MLHTNILILQGFCQFSKWYIVICSVQQSLKLCKNRWHARSSLFNDGVAEYNALQKCAPSLISQKAVVAASKIVTKLDSKAFHAWIRSSTVVDLWERSKHSTAAVAATFHLASRNIESWVAKQNSGTLFDQRCMTGLTPAFANSVLMRASTDHRYGTEYNVDSAAGVKPAGNCVPAAWSFDGLVSPSCNRMSITQVMKRTNHLNKL